jgi:glycosyltransferase involved in cell wall biosynthesis
MKVFLSAYACEPGKGSEPGVGWRWANGLAGRVDLTVLTRESNRKAIEANLADGMALKTTNFIYHDLAGPWLWAKRMGLLPTMAYYALWQWTASKRFAAVADGSDVIHHLTFCTLLCPGFWKPKHARFVLGPVGAPQVNPHYLPIFGHHAAVQTLRRWLLERFLGLPWLRRLVSGAAIVVPANSETRGFLLRHGIDSQDVILDTGAPDVPQTSAERHSDGVIRLMYAGQLERRKGLELSLRALARAGESGLSDWRFDIFGHGPDRRRLEQIANDLEIARRVVFHGAVSHEELSRRFSEADAFIFTSVRDTSGGVNLEAMAHGLPLVCIAQQGVGDVTDDSCAERVPPGPIPETVAALSAAILRLASDPVKRNAMGQAAVARCAAFTWDEKFTRMLAHYRDALTGDHERKTGVQ